MHPLFPKASNLTGSIIGAAIEVHREIGPGLLESLYEWCLQRECELRGIHILHQGGVRGNYKGACRDEILRFDLLIEDCVLVEAKAVDHVLPIHKAQLLSYMKLLNVPLGLLINFNVERLADGVSRMVLPGAGI